MSLASRHMHVLPESVQPDPVIRDSALAAKIANEICHRWPRKGHSRWFRAHSNELLE